MVLFSLVWPSSAKGNKRRITNTTVTSVMFLLLTHEGSHPICVNFLDLVFSQPVNYHTYSSVQVWSVSAEESISHLWNTFVYEETLMKRGNALRVKCTLSTKFCQPVSNDEVDIIHFLSNMWEGASRSVFVFTLQWINYDPNSMSISRPILSLSIFRV